MSALVSDPEGDTPTAKRYIVCNTNATPTQAEIDGTAGGRVLAVGNFSTTPTVVAGLAQTTQVWWWIYAADSNHPNLAGGATLSPMQTATTATLAAPTVTPTVGDGKVTLTWPGVTGAVSYDLYTSTSSSGPGGATTPTATGVTSPRDVAGTNGVPQHSWIRAVDAAGNKSVWSSDAAATPAAPPYGVFTNDFSAGQALNTTFIGTNGTVSVASNQMDATAGVAFLKHVVDTALNRRYGATVVIPANGYTLGICQRSTDPAVDGAIDADRRVMCNPNASGDLIVRYWGAGHAQYSYNWTGANAGTWQATTGGANEYLTSPFVGSINQVLLEIDYNAGTPRFRYIVKSQDGSTTLGTTAWVSWSLLEAGSGSYKVFGTSAIFKTLKCEAF
jgi:hypothetical protein